jgi:mannosyltransferase
VTELASHTPARQRTTAPGPRPGPRPGRRRPPAAVLLFAPLLAAALSVYEISGRSLGFDEGATFAIASQHGSALSAAIAHDGGNMSGYYLVMHVLVGAFGDGLLVLRLPSALATVATVSLIEAIGERLWDRRTGVVAGTLAAVSLPLVYWAQTARGYAAMAALVCAGCLAFIALADETVPSHRLAWIAYVGAMTLAMYSSFVAVLIVPAQLLVLVRRRGVLRRYATALTAVALCCLPLVILAVRRGSGQLFWVSRPNRMVDTQVLDSLTSAGLQPSFHHTATTYLLLWATMASLAVLALDVVRRQRRGDRVWGRALALSWCAVPAALTFAYSLVAQPIFVPRNLLMSTPAVGLALAPAIADRRLPRWLAAAALVAVVGLRAEQVVAAYGVSPEPWHEVTADVLARSRPGDCIAFYPEDGRMAFQYYGGTGAAAVGRAPRPILPSLRWGTVRPYVEDYATLAGSQLRRAVAGCRRLWFVSSHEGQRDGPAQSRINRARYLRLDAELERLLGAAPIRTFGYAGAIHVQLLPGSSDRVSPLAGG